MDITTYYPNQDPSVVYLYEVIGSYFTDIIFNHIYINTKLKLTKNVSLTDEYIRKLQLYVIGVKNDIKCYNSVIKELYKFYINVMSNPVDCNSFLLIIINSCVPNQFISQLQDTQKDEIVSNIICDLVSNMAVYASSPELIKCIIDDRKINPNETIKILQDFAIQFLINKKISILNKFVKETGQINEENAASYTLINNMKKLIRKLHNEKEELFVKIKELGDELKNKEDRCKDQDQNIQLLMEREYKLKQLIILIQKKNKIEQEPESEFEPKPKFEFEPKPEFEPELDFETETKPEPDFEPEPELEQKQVNQLCIGDEDECCVNNEEIFNNSIININEENVVKTYLDTDDSNSDYFKNL
jgi:hypothetical protein